MQAYLRAMVGHLGTATFDVLFVALIGLMPLMIGRWLSGQAPYWAFLTNGQLAFFSMGSLASLLLLCLRKRLPDQATLWIGGFAIICLLFLMALVGRDPTLQAAAALVGEAALYLYGIVTFVRIVAEAMKSVGQKEALEAGAAASRRTEDGLRQRMKGSGL